MVAARGAFATYLAFRSEDRLLTLLEQVAILGAHRHAEVEELFASKGREDLSAKAVLPVVEEGEVARPAKTCGSAGSLRRG